MKGSSHGTAGLLKQPLLPPSLLLPGCCRHCCCCCLRSSSLHSLQSGCLSCFPGCHLLLLLSVQPALVPVPLGVDEVLSGSCE